MGKAIEGSKLKPFIERSAQSSMEEWVGVGEGESLMLGKRSGVVDTERTGGEGGGEASQSQPAASPAPTSAEAS